MDRYIYNILDEFEYSYDTIHLTTYPATGQTWLFDGGYFRQDGVFIRTETFNRL